MFDLIPFEHRNHRYMNPFADLERSFFGDFGDLEKDFPCKTDILDKGDHYLVKADLPGLRQRGHPHRCRRRLPDHFRREKERNQGGKGQLHPPGAPVRLSQPQL